MSRKYKFHKPNAAYFVSFTTVYWIDVFIRQFWQQHNKPIELWSGKVIKQKIDDIHNNAVEQGFVTDPTHWKYSNEKNYADDETVLK